MKRYLVLAPHTDDGELGCGGTIARLVEEENEVYYVAFSTCKESVPEGFAENILESELYKAMETLKIPKERIYIFDFPVRKFGDFRQEILDEMIKLNTEIKPDIVFAPSPRDIHQDHLVISNEAKRAYKKNTLLAYEVPWNNFEFMNQAYYKLEKSHIEKKIKAIRCYDTQKNRPYVDPDFTFGQAKLHGVQIGVDYAEVFEVIRWIN